MFFQTFLKGLLIKSAISKLHYAFGVQLILIASPTNKVILIAMTNWYKYNVSKPHQ
jgi:hypothetical protein